MDIDVPRECGIGHFASEGAPPAPARRDHPLGQDQALVADVVPDGIGGPHPLDQAGFDGGPLVI
jgi:hypothetical protein